MSRTLPVMKEDSRVQYARLINSAIVSWLDLKDRTQRAAIVITWVRQNVPELADTKIRDVQLAAAMGHQKYWCQGPDDYLDMLFSITAVFNLEK